MKLEFNINANIHHHGSVAGMCEVRCLLEKVMSAISDFADKMAIHNNAVDAAIAGLQGDVKSLGGQIAALQSTQGAISAEDQALLDGIEAKAADVSAKLNALDALTPPVSPPA